MSHRLALVIHALTHGGAERVFAQLASHWAEQGRDVTLITLSRAESDTYPVHPSVKRIGLDLQRESRNWWQRISNSRRRISALRKALQGANPDVVVSFTDKSNMLALQAAVGLKCRVVIAERTDPRHHDIGRTWSFLRRRIYPRANLLVVQTEGVARYCAAQFGCPIQVISNAAPQVPPFVGNPTHRSEKRLIAVGRLDPHKGFDVVIRAFQHLREEFPDWKLQIIGTGPQLTVLEGLIRDCGLEEAVELSGWIGDILPVLQQGDLFVSASRYEGFPNALLEAMACGLPAVSFDCESGPAEIIRNGVDGVLVPNGDAERLEQALCELMRDEIRRLALGHAARDVSTRFSPEQFFQRWDEALGAPPTTSPAR